MQPHGPRTQLAFAEERRLIPSEMIVREPIRRSFEMFRELCSAA